MEVIDQAAGTRVANLYGGHGADKVCRTLAVTGHAAYYESLLKPQSCCGGCEHWRDAQSGGFTAHGKKLLIKTEVPANEAFVALANGTTTRGHSAVYKSLTPLCRNERQLDALCSTPKPATRLTSRQFMKK